MEGPRAPFDHELPEVVGFLNSKLRPQQTWSIAEEYPLVINTANLNNFRIIKDGNKTLSSAVMKPLLIKTPVGIFKVGAIGSVVTDEQYRNQGLSRSVLEECLLVAQKHGCDFSILWTDLFDFYRKIGFEMGGSEISLILGDGIAETSQPHKVLESNKIDAEALLRLYSTHSCGSIRTVDDIRKLLLIPNMRVYTSWDPTNKMLAYAVEGKGADLSGYIHEWGGSVSNLVPLITWIRKTQGKKITVITPPHAQNLIRTLLNLGAQKTEGILGMIKLLNPSNLLLKVKRHARALGIEHFVFEQRDGYYYLGSGEQLFRTDSEQDIIKLIFGPLKASQIHDFDEKTRELLESVLPIPMWIWGWDSV